MTAIAPSPPSPATRSASTPATAMTGPRSSARWSSRSRKLTKGAALIDGEIVAFKDGRTDFSTLKDALSSGAPLTYFAFDLLERDGEDLTKLPLTERKERLRKLIGKRGKNDPDPVLRTHRRRGREVLRGDVPTAAMKASSPSSATQPLSRRAQPRSGSRSNARQRQEFVIGGWRPSEQENDLRLAAARHLGEWQAGLSRPRRHRL